MYPCKHLCARGCARGIIDRQKDRQTAKEGARVFLGWFTRCRLRLATRHPHKTTGFRSPCRPAPRTRWRRRCRSRRPGTRSRAACGCGGTRCPTPESRAEQVGYNAYQTVHSNSVCLSNQDTGYGLGNTKARGHHACECRHAMLRGDGMDVPETARPTCGSLCWGRVQRLALLVATPTQSKRRLVSWAYALVRRTWPVCA